MAFTYSPLRYPGGKSSLSKFLAQVLGENGLSGGTYIEPFAGGAGAALNLLFNGYVNNIILNDADPLIATLWRTILRSPERLISRILKEKLTMESWYNCREIIRFPENADEFEVGYATFFLNRCNHSGILKAGPIGGYAQEGKWKIDARFRKEKLAKKIEMIAEHSDQIAIYNLDVLTLLAQDLPECSDNTLVYLDPPYYCKGKELYLNFYNHEDHEQLAAFMATYNTHQWVMTYDDVPQLREFYRNFRLTDFTLNYSAHRAKKGSELLICPHNLTIPNDGISVCYGRLAKQQVVHSQIHEQSAL